MESTTPQETLIEVDARFMLAIVGLLALGTAVVFSGVSIWISIVNLFFVLVMLSLYSRSKYSVVYFPNENRICRVTSNGDIKCIVVENGGIITLTTLNRYWRYVVSATNNNQEMDLVVTGKYQQAKYVAERLSALTGASCKLDNPIFGFIKY